MGRVVVDLKARPIKRKTIAGPILPLVEPSFKLALSIVAPGPHNWRVEPHLVYDPQRGVPSTGLIEITGNLVLARHEGVEAILLEGLRGRVYPAYHLAPWGLPVLTPPLESKTLPSDLEAALHGLGAWRVEEWARKRLAPCLEVVGRAG